MADNLELAELRRKLAEEQRLRLEAEHQRNAAEARRKVAEDLAMASQPQNLESYLESCHSLSLAIDVVTDRSLTTQGEVTNPVGRIFPRTIIPWHAFPTEQEQIWAQLSTSSSFSSDRLYPSRHQIDYVMSLIEPISSEVGLRVFARETVENAVKKLVDVTNADPVLRRKLGLQGTVTFESHTNLGVPNADLSRSMGQLSVLEDDLEPTPPPQEARTARRKLKGTSSLADQFCIYRMSDGRNIPSLAIEYKAPHKLMRDTCISGLQSEIQPEHDVINKDGEGFEFASKSLVSAVITQLFSYMIGKGIKYGYVNTGEVFVFLHIPNDPTTVYYSLCVPNLDVVDGDDLRLHRTAVAQVFAFVLQALQTEPPPMAWYDAAAELSTWAMEYDDILRKIPETERKPPRASPYKSQRWKGFKRSPIRTRSHCKEQSHVQRDANDDSDGDEYTPPSPTLRRLTRSSARTPAARSQARTSRANKKAAQPSSKQSSILNRPYCTQRCLLGLANGAPVDTACPNALDHEAQHLDRREFLRLVKEQLATDRDADADCAPLYASGLVGSLFKVRLSSHGYTLVAKGTESSNLFRLRHECNIYSRLRAVQGENVPVCLGMIDVALPLYCDGGVYEHLLFLSWAGRSVSHCLNQLGHTLISTGIAGSYTKVHNLGIIQNDAALRNFLYDERNGKFMLADFERAKYHPRQPLGLVSEWAQNRKRKRTIPGKPAESVFTAELRAVLAVVPAKPVETTNLNVT
ncbi:hypothetical protein JX265_014015 [Neoarthrinium moseri]|uniref:Uncharacterized protein n=3 Tax=Neoarthrinium moseri TaxID=1658444 RepID=A0A9Q0AHZ5_9PEZI|nr:hypothetical protein JX265_014015 [Neoarthrinium moseri]